jgi:hypothetical protein
MQNTIFPKIGNFESLLECKECIKPMLTQEKNTLFRMLRPMILDFGTGNYEWGSNAGRIAI